MSKNSCCKHGPFGGRKALFAYIRGYMFGGLPGIGIDKDTELAICAHCGTLIKPPKGFVRFTQSLWPATIASGLCLLLTMQGLTHLLSSIGLFVFLATCGCGILPIVWVYRGRWNAVFCEAGAGNGNPSTQLKRLSDQYRAEVLRRKKSTRHRISKIAELVCYCVLMSGYLIALALAN